MLTKEEWLQAEVGNNSIGYKNFEQECRALIFTYQNIIFSLFIYYGCFLFLDWIVFSKIILGIANLVNITSFITLPVAIFGYFDLKNIKNKWLKDSRIIQIHSAVISFICICCYIYFVFFEKPLPYFLKNIVAFIILLVYFIWFKNNENIKIFKIKAYE